MVYTKEVIARVEREVRVIKMAASRVVRHAIRVVITASSRNHQRSKGELYKSKSTPTPARTCKFHSPNSMNAMAVTGNRVTRRTFNP